MRIRDLHLLGGNPLAGSTARDRREVTITCDTPGCKDPTRERKPKCSVHCMSLPYAKRVMEELARQEREDELARQSLPVSTDSATAQDILVFLRTQGPKTEQGLSRECNVDLAVVRGYVATLQKHGLVGLRRGTRGRTFVEVC